jgi:hypothetical protein
MGRRAPTSGARASIDSLRKRSTPALSESGRIHGGIAPLTVAIAHGALRRGVGISPQQHRSLLGRQPSGQGDCLARLGYAPAHPGRRVGGDGGQPEPFQGDLGQQDPFGQRHVPRKPGASWHWATAGDRDPAGTDGAVIGGGPSGRRRRSASPRRPPGGGLSRAEVDLLQQHRVGAEPAQQFSLAPGPCSTAIHQIP